MSVLRWVISDPSDVNPVTNHYTFPRNPMAMTSVYSELPITAQTSTQGHIMLWEGATPAKQWQFNGPILDRQHLIDLYAWVKNKHRRLILHDHFGRQITLVFTSLDLVPKRRVGYYYSHDYTASALVLHVTATTVPDSGPV